MNKASSHNTKDIVKLAVGFCISAEQHIVLLTIEYKLSYLILYLLNHLQIETSLL
jgi:hypothetical protein